MPPEAIIAGLGITSVGKVFGRSAADLATEAVRLAVADAGLQLPDIDGLLVSSGTSGDLDLSLQNMLGVRDLRLLSQMHSFGATAASMIAAASMAITFGTASVVACVFADTPLRPQESVGAAYAARRRNAAAGFGSLEVAVGGNANVRYALAARRHMEAFGTTSEHFGAIAVAQRRWAMMNDRAQMRVPLTLEEHQASRLIVEPFHLYDCCLVSNGAVAVLVTHRDRAADLPHPAIHVLGFGQGHPGQVMERGSQFGLRTGAKLSGESALRMAGVTRDDVDALQLYDCYTYTVLVTIEDYGFCEKGEGGPFVREGHTAPGGKLPTNTGGGQLSSFYLWGMTPLSEAVIQARGQAGERQLDRHEVIMVSGNGGILDYHSTLVLSPSPRDGV
jgi:acetyl-CoA acetyltransferase